MRRIEFKLKKGLKSSVYALSFVEFPAIEEDLTYLSKDYPVLLSMEKGIVYTPVLIPNKDILRKDSKGEKYNMYFSEDTVRQAAHDFISSGGDLVTEFNYEHDSTQKLSDVAVVENWVIEDPKNDKAALYGFSHLPKGTWMQAIKVENEQVKQAIKDKKIKGISLEGYFDKNFEENLSNINQIEMNEKKELLGTMIDRLFGTGKTTLSTEEVKAEETKMAEIKDGVYPIGDGKALVVKDRMIIEVREMEEVEGTEEKKEEMSEVEQLAEATVKATEAQSKEIESLNERLSKIEVTLSKIEETPVELKATKEGEVKLKNLERFNLA